LGTLPFAKSLLDTFGKALNHDKLTTELIQDLAVKPANSARRTAGARKHALSMVCPVSGEVGELKDPSDVKLRLSLTLPTAESQSQYP
jgi:hypothetical protein